jgi:putative ABC transport system ATP-binding protein
MSGGEQQRVAIARSLVVNPQVILADEPTGALDTDTGNEIMEILSDLVEERRITVVVVTHEPHIADWTKRSILMRDGLILDDRTSIAPVTRLEE